MTAIDAVPAAEVAPAGADAAEAVTGDSPAARIGASIRRLRKARGLTLVQLADRAELSHPFLSQLERGLASPSIGSLEKIARALGSSQVELFADSGADSRRAAVSLVRADEGTRGPYAEGEARYLVRGESSFHPMELTGSNAEFGDYFRHAEDEFVIVVAGRVAIDLEPSGVVELAVGDSIYYAGGTPHRWRSLEPGGYRLFVVKEHPRAMVIR